MIHGLEAVHATSTWVRLLGDERANTLVASGCNLLVDGGGGAHRLEIRDSATDCVEHIILGGPGADRLVGGPADDTLFGRVGRDVADGPGGTDLCRAEVRRNCERS